MANSNRDRRDISAILVVGAEPAGLVAAMDLAPLSGAVSDTPIA